MMWRSRWLLSLRILAFVAILFILQAIPFTGVFLMMVAAPLWSIPLVTLAVVVAGIEGLTGRAPRWFIAVPVAWFGLYALAVAGEETALETARAEIAAANESVRPLPFDPDRQAVLVDRYDDSWLLDHRLPVVYVRPPAVRRDAIAASRLAAGDLCETLKSRGGRAEVTVRRVFEATARRHGFDAPMPLCIVSFAEEPAGEVVEITRTRETATAGDLDVRVIRVRAETGGQVAEVRGASAAILQRFPMPMLGCALNSGAPSWDCFASFMRRTPDRFGVDEKAAPPAVLDLSALDRRIPGDAENRVLLERLAAADIWHARRHEAAIEDVLADPGAVSVANRLINDLARDPAALGPYADRLVSALETADAGTRRDFGLSTAPASGATGRAGGGNPEKAALTLVRLVSLLPDDAFRAEGARIIALLDEDRAGWRRYDRWLVRRAGDLGPAALPMLLSRLDRPARRRDLAKEAAGAIVALCRMGLPDAAPAGPRLVALWEERRRARAEEAKLGEPAPPRRLSEEDRLLYAALLRLGLGEAAGPLEGRDAAAPFAQVTPASPREACDAAR